jgi:hypothetical protein
MKLLGIQATPARFAGGAAEQRHLFDEHHPGAAIERGHHRQQAAAPLPTRSTSVS